MQLIHRLFREHPESVGESYLEHLFQASYFGGECSLLVSPALFTRSFPASLKPQGVQRYQNFTQRCWLSERHIGTRPF